MYRIDDPSASPTLPTPEAALTEGYWTEGNPGTGTPATLERASWFNMIQEELRAVVVAAGLTPSKTTYTQVRDAIKRIGQNTIILADTGAANAYTAVNATPLVAGTWVDGVVQAVKIAHANTGASTYAPDGLTAIPVYGLGLQPLQGGELALNGTAILMHATIAGVNSGNPIAVLMECAGGAAQIAPATASGHAVNLGQLTSTASPLALATLAAASANQAVNLGQFGSSLGVGGYQKLPSGMIIQWGTTTTTTSGSTVTFPIAFPNVAYGVTATSLNSSAIFATYQNLTTSGLTMQAWTTSAVQIAATVTWIAIGK